MTRTPRVTAIVVILALAVFSAGDYLPAQEKRTSATPGGSVRGPSKRSTSAARSDANTPATGRQKPISGAAKTRDENTRALDQANDYWTTGYGGFHMFGNDGHAVYRFPAEAAGTGYDTNWSFTDDYAVGGREGWTYKESGYDFYMFFAKVADANGKWWVGYSFENSVFHLYAWAD
jgi:hypothetical protein